MLNRAVCEEPRKPSLHPFQNIGHFDGRPLTGNLGREFARPPRQKTL